MAGSDQPQPRYSAFLSYSQGDARVVRRLHRRLETYRLPARLVARSTLEGRRLKPVFRDRDELAAAHDLTQAVREALRESEHLIVVCSPRSAQSKWVGREIELFRQQHGEQGIITAVIEGNLETAFHPALRRRPHGRATEPLAADFRPGGGGEHLALLKLIAPLAGVRLDDLIHRDAQRRNRQIIGVAGAGLAGMAAMSVLAGVAFVAQQNAERERNKAQALVGAMSSDLRADAKDVASLGYLGKLNKAAAGYFRGQDPGQLSDKALQERATLLHNMGEDDEKRGDLAAAQRDFDDAARDTGQLLAKAPQNSQRIFEHAQSEYWVGFSAWRREDWTAARRHWETYAALADRLVRTDPMNDKWAMEVAYAATNLGMISLRQAGRPEEAQVQFRKALDIHQRIAEHTPDDPSLQREIAKALAWLADAERVGGDLQRALVTRREQQAILVRLLAKSPNSLAIRRAILDSELAVARIEIAQGKLRAAEKRLVRGRTAGLELAHADPDNKDVLKEVRMFELFTVKVWLAEPANDRPAVQSMTARLGDCKPRVASLANEEIDDFCEVLLARIREMAGDRAGARSALASLSPHAAAHQDVLTAHWGLNLREETGTTQLATAGARSR